MGCAFSTYVAAKKKIRRRRTERRKSSSKEAEVPREEEVSGGAVAPPVDCILSSGGGSQRGGWPPWLLAAVGDAIGDWTPRSANTFEKLDKIGQGTYSNVYKAKDLITGKIVALKKVRFDNLEPESIKFMAKEILVLRKLDHPNVIKLEGLVTSRMSSSLYLVFEYMEHDLTGLAAAHGSHFTEPQVKCYMKQLISGLEHCHQNGVLHRDIKCSNLLIDNEGVLKIADFGLASFYDPERKQSMTSRVVTLWYRPPELLLGATNYGVGVDLWSAGCILAELLAGKPILPGRTEVEQIHKIFKLCGSPTEAYWKKSRLPNATLFKPQQRYKCCIAETFKDFPRSAISLIQTLLAIDPDDRGSATLALNSEFFTTEPIACDPSNLPKYPPSKEMDLKIKDQEARRQRGQTGQGARKLRVRERGGQAIPAPEANAELQMNLDRRRLMRQSNGKSKSEKFPPPHQDGAVGYPPSQDAPTLFSTADNSFSKSASVTGGPSRRKNKKEEPHKNRRKLIHAFLPSTFGMPIDLRPRRREAVSENFSRQGDGRTIYALLQLTYFLIWLFCVLISSIQTSFNIIYSKKLTQSNIHSCKTRPNSSIMPFNDNLEF